MEEEIIRIEDESHVHTSCEPSTIYSYQDENFLSILVTKCSDTDIISIFENNNSNYTKHKSYKPFTIIYELKNYIRMNIISKTDELSIDEDEDYTCAELFEDLCKDEFDFLTDDSDHSVDMKEDDYNDFSFILDIINESFDYDVPPINDKCFLLDDSLEPFDEDFPFPSGPSQPVKEEFPLLEEDVTDKVYTLLETYNNDLPLRRINLYDKNSSYYDIFYNGDSVITTLDISDNNHFSAYKNILKKYMF